MMSTFGPSDEEMRRQQRLENMAASDDDNGDDEEDGTTLQGERKREISNKKGRVCASHGAKVKRCSHEGCTKQSQNGGVCVRQGALVKRCSHEGCTNIIQKGEKFVSGMARRCPSRACIVGR